MDVRELERARGTYSCDFTLFNGSTTVGGCTQKNLKEYLLDGKR